MATASLCRSNRTISTRAGEPEEKSQASLCLQLQPAAFSGSAVELQGHPGLVNQGPHLAHPGVTEVENRVSQRRGQSTTAPRAFLGSGRLGTGFVQLIHCEQCEVKEDDILYKGYSFFFFWWGECSMNMLLNASFQR